MAGTQRRGPPLGTEPVGVSKNVPKSRFISCWSELISRAGSHLTSAMLLPPDWNYVVRRMMKSQWAPVKCADAPRPVADVPQRARRLAAAGGLARGGGAGDDALPVAGERLELLGREVVQEHRPDAGEVGGPGRRRR